MGISSGSIMCHSSAAALRGIEDQVMRILAYTNMKSRSRWTAYDAKRFGSKPLPGARMTITERAYTAPIWYTPN